MQRALLPAASAATSGHVTLLKQKALTAILRRLDALLFGKLLGGAPVSIPMQWCMLQLGTHRLVWTTQQSAGTCAPRAHERL